jgi:excisionase family DNA binding protein
MNPNERMLRLLQATPEQLAAIDRLLEGKLEPSPPARTGPLTMMVCDAADYLGVHRATIHRLIKAKRLTLVPLLGGFRVRRDQLDAIALGKEAA